MQHIEFIPSDSRLSIVKKMHSHSHTSTSTDTTNSSLPLTNLYTYDSSISSDSFPHFFSNSKKNSTVSDVPSFTSSVNNSQTTNTESQSGYKRRDTNDENVKGQRSYFYKKNLNLEKVVESCSKKVYRFHIVYELF